MHVNVLDMIGCQSLRAAAQRQNGSAPIRMQDDSDLGAWLLRLAPPLSGA